MRSLRELRSWLRRGDVPLTLALAQAITLLTLALLILLFGVSSHETAELLEETLERDVQRVAERIERAEPVANVDVAPGTTVRLFEGAEGRLLVGRSYPGGRYYDDDTAALRLAFASSSDWFCDWEKLDSRRRLQGCVRLAGFVHERREQLAQLAGSFLVGLFGVLAVSVYATRKALAPLRNATRSIENVNERHLEARIPLRGTGDLVDRHAEALNRVLARLEESFARMSDFSADVAHELRTPVNRILNLADVGLLGSEAGSAERALDAIRDGAEQMRRLIEDMLLLARGDEGRLAPKREPVDVAALLDDLADLYLPKCEEEGIAIERSGAASLRILSDRPLFERAVSNLVDNAIRHTPRGGAIHIDAATRPGALTIAVSDTGPGIPAAARERIFERFVQLDAARRSGAGLGLPIARMIARTLGGDLRAADAPAGARFELVLPV